MADVFNGAPAQGAIFNYTEGDARYVNEADFTKAAIDALGIDAATLEGHAASYFAVAGEGGGGSGTIGYAAIAKFCAGC